MTPQEAIKRIQKHNEIHSRAEKGFAVRITEALNMACEALDYRTPRKPEIEGDGYDDNGNLIYDTGICPVCRERYEIDYETPKFCKECGQALDWSGAEC